MSALVRIALPIVGTDICEVCFLRDEVTERRNKNTNYLQKLCISCNVKEMNKGFERGEIGKFPLGDRILDIVHAERGTRKGEVILYERITVTS